MSPNRDRQVGHDGQNQPKVSNMDRPLAESYVSLRLSEIQERFIELMQEELTELRLEDPDAGQVGDDPYNRYG
jgi:hypothetical protein